LKFAIGAVVFVGLFPLTTYLTSPPGGDVTSERGRSLAASASASAAAAAASADERRRAAAADVRLSEEAEAARLAHETEQEQSRYAAMTPAQRMDSLRAICSGETGAALCAPKSRTVAPILAAAKSDHERNAMLDALTTLDRSRVPDPPPVKAADHGKLCLLAAKRFVARMHACELSTAGLTAESLCTTFDYDRLSFAASRDCAQLAALLSGATP